MKKIFKAFTLAETLITMIIIGVIAVLILPKLFKEVSSWIFTEQNNVFEAKLKEIMNQMHLDVKLMYYDTNEEFVNSFQKYVKVIKRCTSSNLEECFVPRFKADTVTMKIGKDLIYGTDLGQSNNRSELSGVVLLDGTAMIIAYNPDCSVTANIYDTSADKTGCLSILYDLNGMGAPNRVGADIRTLNATLTECIWVGTLRVATGDITSYSPYGTFVDQNGITKDNYWLGAMKACENLGMRLPTIGELRDVLYNHYKNEGNAAGFSAKSYLSSKEMTSYIIQVSRFDINGTAGNADKGVQYRIRCVR